MPCCDLQVIDFFLRQKWELDEKDNPSMEDITTVCHALTTVRALLLGGLNRWVPQYLYALGWAGMGSGCSVFHGCWPTTVRALLLGGLSRWVPEITLLG